MLSSILELSAVVATAVAFGPLPLGCGGACHTVKTGTLPVVCTENSSFSGELHFDDGATFAAFLERDCMPDTDAATVTRLVDAVDFTRDVVFVAVGFRDQAGRCLAERAVEGVETCDTGLRVTFADVEVSDERCEGKWTVALTVPRAPMRVALGTR